MVRSLSILYSLQKLVEIMEPKNFIGKNYSLLQKSRFLIVPLQELFKYYFRSIKSNLKRKAMKI